MRLVLLVGLFSLGLTGCTRLSPESMAEREPQREVYTQAQTINAQERQRRENLESCIIAAYDRLEQEEYTFETHRHGGDFAAQDRLFDYEEGRTPIRLLRRRAQASEDCLRANFQSGDVTAAP